MKLKMFKLRFKNVYSIVYHNIIAIMTNKTNESTGINGVFVHILCYNYFNF